MPDLNFQINSVHAEAQSLTPILRFHFTVTNQPADEPIHALLLNVQIQIQSPQRSYSRAEKEKLVELFGTPDCWGQTLRARLWTIVTGNVRGFSGSTDATLTVPCTYDLTVAATKYFYALDGGEVPLLFLFSGTVFHAGPGGEWRVQPIPWDREATYRMPLAIWKELMEQHHPNTAWLYLNRDVFNRFYAFKCSHGLATWEQAMETLLPGTEKEKVA
jgi:uncharacterized protein DUF6084